MSRNYWPTLMATEAAAAHDAAKRAELRAAGISTLPPPLPAGERTLVCEDCSGHWHPDAVDHDRDGWRCPGCNAFYEL